ncbi:MAG: DUF2089 family protein [Candidatus Hydrogenedentes bacterium]|nr:DUF2089 family protein [Candidatus Hydrogenedentota bacterium]
MQKDNSPSTEDSRKLPRSCPSCGAPLRVQRFTCHACSTAVEGDFALPVLARLEPEEQEFLLHLLEESGSLKGLAQQYQVSYPTVRNRLDALREKVRRLVAEQRKPLKGDDG